MTRLDDPRELEALLGAYALDACDPDEAEAIEAYLARTPRAAREVDRLRNAAAWVGATEALTPPPRLRTGVLERARARRSASSGPDSVSELFESEMARMDALLGDLPVDALGRRTHNGLTVRQLVAHLVAQETQLAASIGAPLAGVDIDVDELEPRTAAFVERYGDRPVDEVRQLWRRAVDAVAAWARGDDGSRPVRFFGLELSREMVLVMRVFETWVHREDIGRVLREPPAPPEPSGLHLMANLAMQLLPGAMDLVGRAHPDRTARIVLTGAGGGEWLLPLSATTEPTADADVTVSADIVDFCLLFGERLAPEQLPRAVEGDAALADDLLVAAPAFATL